LLRLFYTLTAEAALLAHLAWVIFVVVRSGFPLQW
jgi:hypothetical protein